MEAETSPGELGRDDAEALRRLSSKLQLPVPEFDREERLILREMVEQWKYDKQRQKNETAAKLERRASLPLKVAIASACMTAAGWAVNFVTSRLSGHP